MRVRDFLFSVMIYTFTLVFMLALLVIATYYPIEHWTVWWISFIILFIGFLFSLYGLEKTGRELEKIDGIEREYIDNEENNL